MYNFFYDLIHLDFLLLFYFAMTIVILLNIKKRHFTVQYEFFLLSPTINECANEIAFRKLGEFDVESDTVFFGKQTVFLIYSLPFT